MLRSRTGARHAAGVVVTRRTSRGVERDAGVDVVHRERELRRFERDRFARAEFSLVPARRGSLEPRDATRAMRQTVPAAAFTALDGEPAFLVPVATSPVLGYASHMDYRAIITIEPGKRGGKPCIRGLRITVYDVLEYLASGMSEAELLADFPDLTSDDIRACLAFAADRERRLLSVPAA